MKIAYLFHLNKLNDGVYKKIVSQLVFWEAEGHSVKAFHVTRDDPLAQEQWYIFKYTPHINGLVSRLNAWDKAVKNVLVWKPDIVYYRYDVYYPALRQLMKNIPTIVEINTNDVKEYFLGSIKRGLYNFITRGCIFSNASGIVFVTHELSLLQSFCKYNKKFIVIGNGIDLNLFEPLSPTNNKFPRMVFIGSPNQQWHGVDKIVKLADMQPSWLFDLIGFTESDLGIRLPKNIICRGYLEQSEYKKVLAKADVAIGTLALHRNGMNEGSPLKVREYLAFGLPVIIGYQDTDFPVKSEFILQLPNCEANVDENIELIKSFVYKWMGKRVARNQIYHLDLKVKERKRLEFMEEVILHI